MKEKNKKKLATIKSEIMNSMFSQMGSKDKDKDFAEALAKLGKAMEEVERQYGPVD